MVKSYTMSSQTRTLMSADECCMRGIRRYFTKNSDLMDKTVRPIVENKNKSNISLRFIEHTIIDYCRKWDIVYFKTDGTPFMVYSRYKSELESFKKHYFDPFRRSNHIVFQYDKQHLQFEFKDEERIIGLPSDTPVIMADGTVCPICDIDVDDVVLDKNNTEVRVINVYEWEDENKYNIETKSGGYMISRELKTTIGQLNFFRWFIDSELIYFILKYQNEIKKDIPVDGICLTSNDKNVNIDDKHSNQDIVVTATPSIQGDSVQIEFSVISNDL